MRLLNKPFTYWLRVLHRDIGYFVTGICLIYALSGILLNHMKEKDPAYRTEEQSLQLEKQLSQAELTVYWQSQSNLPVIKKVMTLDENHSRLLLEGGVGVYNHATGWIDYEVYKKRPFIWWINRFHYNKV
ncbi:MAG: peptidase [Tannerellaceae bacterium]|nr:peptidase [Tannerellaceae bacterium]